ncbi:transcriptional regulator AraC/glutamine amidotransferase [Acidocella aminolytica 101 = DSM 11237]|uniref:Transcriptional regulator AraC/glutamine amidotransferase n=2 Tax=Acidocella TaxID=50709 RepID=A0A0D6PFN7_9PROT|nr:transcriptional regulator AraC/glutamine amidotransferase [Acidocella aminolytica 101 = DSM 11237]GBQ32515.1 putative intracellular protease/amidase [Acidocella aminolytica 101 = DSM 11237]
MPDTFDMTISGAPSAGGPSRRQAMLMGGIAVAAATAGSLVPGGARATTIDEAKKPVDFLFAIYPNGTLLDFAGPHEILTLLPNVKVRFASPAGGLVTLENGVVFGPTEKLTDVTDVDVICVPGGLNLSAMMKPEILAHIKRLSETAKYVTSVCTGSIILAASGALKGKRSACHWAFLNDLKKYGAIPDPSRIVKDGRFISGGGVTAGIDFGLAIAAELRGAQAAQEAQLLVQYDPQPPFHAGNPSDAPPNVRNAVYKMLPGSEYGLMQPIL